MVTQTRAAHLAGRGELTSNKSKWLPGEQSTLALDKRNKEALGHNYDGAENADGQNQKAASQRNLDSGYAWLILAIMFLLQSSISGSSRVYGIVYAREVAIGYYDREQASWPIATASAVENLAGILTPALAQWLSWRQLELMSTSLLVAANLLAYYSDSLALDIIALGLVQGLALSISTVLSLAINNDYFERYRTTAYGIQMSGSTFGVLYLSPLVTWILDAFPGDTNFRLVYLALACVFCVNLLLVLFIRPRLGGTCNSEASAAAAAAAAAVAAVASPEDEQSGKQNGGQLARPQSGFELSAGRKVSRFESHFERKSSIASVSYCARSRRQSVLSRVPLAAAAAAAPTPGSAAPLSQALADDTRQMAKSKSGIELARASSRALMKKISLGSMRQAPAGPPNQRPSVVSSNYDTQSSCARSLSRHSSVGQQQQQQAQQTQLQATKSRPFYLADGDANSLASHCELTGQLEQPAAGAAWAELDPGLLKRLTLEAASEFECQSRVPEPIDRKERSASAAGDTQQQQQQCEQQFSWQLVKGLLKLPYLHCAWIMLALYYLIARILVIILVDFALDHGHELAHATDLLNYWSLGELVGRVLLGSLIDLKFMSCKSCIALACASVASLLTSMVLIESYALYATASLLIAALISLEYMLINVMMVEYLGKHRVTSCYSLAACISSIVLFARPSMIGLFRDQLGTYDGLLLLLAGLSATFALLFCLLEPLFVRRWPKCATVGG